MIFESMDGWNFDDPNHGDTGFIKTYNLTANTQQVTLPVSDKILKVRRVEVTYDGSVWNRAFPMDVNEYSDNTTQVTINQNFITSEPYYDLVGNYIYMYPVPTANVTGGLKIWIDREIDEFTIADTTQEPGIAEPFHEMLAVGASLDYAIQEGLTNQQGLAAKFAEFEQRLRRFYGTREDDQSFVMKPNNEFYEE